MTEQLILDVLNDLMSRVEAAGHLPGGVVLGQQQGRAFAREAAAVAGRPFDGPLLFEKLRSGGAQVWGIPVILVDRADCILVTTADLRGWVGRSAARDERNAAARVQAARGVFASVGAG